MRKTAFGARVAILAYHYARSERQEKAIQYALIAGDQAAGRLHANAEARTYYQQALSMARALPASFAAQRWQIDATLKRASVAMSAPEIEQDRTDLEQARLLGKALHDEARLAQVLYWLGRLSYVKGEPRTAMAFARQSLEIADRLGDDALAAPPVNLLGRVCFVTSEYGQAGQLVARNVEQMRRIGNHIEEATAAGSAGHAFAWIGDFEQAVSYADQGVHLAQATQNPAAEAAAHMYRGACTGANGRWRSEISSRQACLPSGQATYSAFTLPSSGRATPARWPGLRSGAAHCWKRPERLLSTSGPTSFWPGRKSSWPTAC